jgi:hypothetical protein
MSLASMSLSKSGTYLAVISVLPSIFLTLRLTDLSIILWVTDDFGGGDFPKKQFLMDYLRWKEEKPAMGPSLFALSFLLMLTKFDMLVGLLLRIKHVCQSAKRFHTRHALDLIDCAGVLGINLALTELKLASKTTVAACDVLDAMRWNARAYRQTAACEAEALNLRRLYISLMALNLVMLLCPILRHFQWERHLKRKADKTK